MDIKRGDWVRHRPTGRLGTVEAIGGGVASIASRPPAGDGGITGLAADVAPAAAGIESQQPARQQAA